MQFNDHEPPHFHARYGGDEVVIEIDTLNIYSGWVPPTALRLILEWAEKYQEELRKNWAWASTGKSVVPIEPLK